MIRHPRDYQLLAIEAVRDAFKRGRKGVVDICRKAFIPIEMKTIPLTRGLVAIIDDADFEAVSAFKWCATANGYAIRNLRISGVKKMQLLHRFITGASPDKQVDHINMDRLDNRRVNLRICSNAENNRNKKAHIDSSTGIKGVFWCKRRSKFYSQIMTGGKKKFLGYSDTKEGAAGLYAGAAAILHGDFAR